MAEKKNYKAQLAAVAVIVIGVLVASVVDKVFNASGWVSDKVRGVL